VRPPDDPTPWLAPAAGRALRWWSQEALRAVAAELRPVLAGWQSAWALPADSGIVLEPLRQCHLAASRWTTIGALPGAQAWLGLAAADGSAGTWTRELRVGAEADLLARLGHWLQPGTGLDPIPAAAPAALCAPWSGALATEVAGGIWRLLLDVRAAGAGRTTPVAVPAAAASAPLASAFEALSSRRLQWPVQLKGCRLELGVLQSLAPGDVIPLEHALDEPVMVLAGRGACGWAGFLGQAGGAKAVELAAAQG
jgi:hypothetical protein